MLRVRLVQDDNRRRLAVFGKGRIPPGEWVHHPPSRPCLDGVCVDRNWESEGCGLIKGVSKIPGAWAGRVTVSPCDAIIHNSRLNRNGIRSLSLVGAKA